jgi:hypothetical protein
MNISLKPRQVLFLYGLFFLGEGVPISKTRPEIKPLDRRPLLEMDLIRIEKVGRSQCIYLTDHAWDWLSEHLTLPIMAEKGNPSKECALLAEALLTQLQHRVHEGTLTLAEFLAPPKDPSQKLPQEPPQDSQPGEPESFREQSPKKEPCENPPSSSRESLTPQEEALLALCRKVMQEQGTDRVFLRDLRPRLRELSRSDLDGILLSLQQKGRVLLMTYQDPLSRTREDDVAALHIGSISRHVLRLS